MSLDNLTYDHFLRLEAFCQARVDPLLNRAIRAEALADAEADFRPALMALSNDIVGQAAVGGLFEMYEREPQWATATAITTRWFGLRLIARTWRDHPDYLPEFNHEPWELEPAPAKSTQP